MERDCLSSDSMHVAVPRAAGIDVHKMQVTATVRLCEPGRSDAASATRVLGSDPPALRALTDWLGGHGVRAAALEGTGIYWIAPLRAVEEAGIRAALFQAQHGKQIKGRKTDYNDSIWLARVCQFGLARPSYVPPQEFIELRQQCRYRRKLVGDRARTRNRLQKTLDPSGLRVGGVLTDLFGLNGRRILDGLVKGRDAPAILARLSGHVRHKLEPLARLLEDFDRATRRLEDLDGRVEAALAPWQRQRALLETLPGSARTSAHASLAELRLAPTQVFPDAASLAAWAGVCPGNNESAGKRRSGRARPGNPHLRAILTECAQGAARTKDCQFHGYHGAMTARMGYKRAVLTTAHKLLRTVYAILRDDHPYRDPRVNYEALLVKRNAPRWLRMLAEHGFLEEMAACQRARALASMRATQPHVRRARGHRAGLPRDDTDHGVVAANRCRSLPTGAQLHYPCAWPHPGVSRQP